MDDTKRLLERAERLAPAPEFRLDDVRIAEADATADAGQAPRSSGSASPP